MRKIEALLKERQKQHGLFKLHAKVEVKLQGVMICDEDKFWDNCSDVQNIGLQMILHKIARLLSGGINHQDTWEDIAGYATLVAKDMEDNE